MKYKYSITKRIDKNNGEVDLFKAGTKEPTIRELLNKVLVILRDHSEKLDNLDKRVTNLDKRVTKLENK
ncbi:MAG: hypothetical protein LBJ97_00005 [Mycoplasmataceae bacterium]|jgi:polyhydroxyalkanoate synthesis regulator phasin|nr:hypothetical protein [Mycoplasmataceae bacterium]